MLLIQFFKRKIKIKNKSEKIIDCKPTLKINNNDTAIIKFIEGRSKS